MQKSFTADFKLFFTLALISLTLVFIDSLKLLDLPKALVQNITSPIQYGLLKTSKNITNQLEFVFLARRAFQENKARSEQLAQLLVENASLRRKLSEAESFLEQQNSLDPKTFNLVAVRPVGVSRYLYLDKGSLDGLKVNQTVVFKDNFIGKIKSVSSKKSEVLLISDPDSKISAYVANSSGKAKGILAGQFGSDAILDKILHGEQIFNGDLVYTDGAELGIPKGLILGQITDTLVQDNQVFKQAKVKPFFDISNLDVVYVVAD